MKKIVWIAVLLSLFLFSCSKKSGDKTYGRAYEIITFADKGVVNSYPELLDKLAYPIYFTHREYIFGLNLRKKFDISRYYKYKNILIVDDVSTRDEITKELEKIIGQDTMNQVLTVAIAHKKDVWVKGQTVVFLLFNGAKQKDTVVKNAIIKTHIAFYNDINERLKNELKQLKTSTMIAKSAEVKFGFKFFVSDRYKIFKSEKNFLSVVSRLPDRLFFLAEVKNDKKRKIDKEFMIELRDKFTKKYYGGDFVYKDIFDWKKKDMDNNYYAGFQVEYINNIPVYKLWGLWQNDKDNNGGAFFSYAFEKNSKIFYIDGMLFYPGGNKWPYINKMDLTVKNNLERILGGNR